MVNKDRKRLLILEIVGALFVMLSSFLLHFLYKWSGNNFFVGMFAAVNESVFEHTKIVFFPFVIYSVFEYFFVDVDKERFITVKALIAILLPIVVITVFYTYSGIIGHHVMWFDIISVLVYAVLAYIASYRLITRHNNIKRHMIWIVPLFFIVLLAEIFFTIYPPMLPLFLDTEKNFYGMPK